MINVEEQNPEGYDTRFEIGTSRRMKSGSALSLIKADEDSKKDALGDGEDEELAAAKSTAESMEQKRARLFDECIRIQFVRCAISTHIPHIHTHLITLQEMQQAKNAYASVGGLLEEDQEAKRDKDLLQA